MAPAQVRAGVPCNDGARLWACLLGGEHRTEVGSWRAGLGWQKVVCSGEGSGKGPEGRDCLSSSSLEVNPFIKVLPVVLKSPEPGPVTSKVFLATLGIQKTQIRDSSRLLFPVRDLL